MTTETTGMEAAAEAVTLSDDDLKAMGLPPAFTLDELKATLTPKELEALADGDDPIIDLPDELRSKAQGQSALDVARGYAIGEDEAPESAKTVPAEKEDAAATGTDVTATDDADVADTAETTEEPDPVIQHSDTSADEELIAAAKDQRRALREKYSDGEMTDDQLDEALEKLTDEVAEAKLRVSQAKVAEDASITEYTNSWYGRVGSFMEKSPAFADNTPVPELNGASTLQLFDAALLHVTNPETSPHLAALSQAEKLAEGVKLAQSEFRRLTGRDLAAGAPQPASQPVPKPEPAPQPKPKAPAVAEPRPAPLQTLGGVTSATGNEISDGRFAVIDRSTGIDAEREFQSMSAAEQEAFLQGL